MIPTKEQWNDTLIQRHGAARQQTFHSATVAVCGLGGLGSHIAVSLARAGVGRLLLIDFDRVDISNLHRQQYKAAQIGLYKTEALAANLSEIAPYVRVETITKRLTEKNLTQVLKPASIICEALDDAEEKAMLTNGVLEHMPDSFLVAASGMAGMGSPNDIHTRRPAPHFYLCGDETSDVAQGLSLTAPRVMLCAAHQAHTVLRILAGETDV